MADIISVINPATETLVNEITIDSPEVVSEKVARAQNAQSKWARRSLAERITLIRTFRDLLTQQADTLAVTLTAETGKPITQSRNEILATPGRIDFFLKTVVQVLSPTLAYQESALALPGAGQLEEWISYDPLGVIANISAWNYPYFVGANVFIPALLTGNAVLYKPSEIAANTGLAIASLLYQAGIPENVFIPVIGAGVTGAALLDQAIDGVFFTGSHATGQKIATALAPKLIKVQLELGGKDPAYVCDDVDISIAAASLADGAFYNNGQSCCAVERIYVHTHVYDEFLEQFLQAVQQFNRGNPMAADTYLGPVSRKPQLTVLQRQVEDAIAKGATLRCGGTRVERPGWYFAPTVLTEVTHEMLVMREETFGPIIGIQRVDSDQDAIAFMNDTHYGLTAAVYGKERARALRILSQVNSGTVYWNCCDRVSPPLPWSGRQASGMGATLSEEGIRTFLQPRAWHLKQIFA